MYLHRAIINHFSILITLIASFSLFSNLESAQNFQGNLHYDRLSFLKAKGFEPKVIYDIGAYRGHWSLEIHKVFPNGQFYLFEANENNRSYLEKTPFNFYIGILGDKEQNVTFYTNNTTGDSIFCEQTKYYQENNCIKKELPMITLETAVKNNKIPLPDLIKFDVQGAEKLIIQGSQSLIQHAEVLILETKILEYNQKAPLIYETLNLMESLGYNLSDILECHYLPTGELNEIDFLFIKNGSKLIKKGILIQ